MKLSDKVLIGFVLNTVLCIIIGIAIGLWIGRDVSRADLEAEVKENVPWFNDDTLVSDTVIYLDSLSQPWRCGRCGMWIRPDSTDTMLAVEYERGCSDTIEAYRRIKNDDLLVNLFKGWWFGRIDMMHVALKRFSDGAEYQLQRSERLPIWSWDKAVFLNLTDDMPERFYMVGNPWHGKRISSLMIKSFYDDIDGLDIIPVWIDDSLDEVVGK